MTLPDGVIVAIVVGLPVLGFLTGAWVMWWYVKDVLAEVRQQNRRLASKFEDMAQSISDAAARVYAHAVGERADDVPGSKRAEPQAGPLGLAGGYTGVTAELPVVDDPPTVVFEDEIVEGELVDTKDQPLLEPRNGWTPKVPDTPQVPSLSDPLIEFIENTQSTVVHEPTCKLVPEWSRDTDRFEKLWQMTRGELSELIAEGKMRACKQCRPDRAKETV